MKVNNENYLGIVRNAVKLQFDGYNCYDTGPVFLYARSIRFFKTDIFINISVFAHIDERIPSCKLKQGSNTVVQVDYEINSGYYVKMGITSQSNAKIFNHFLGVELSRVALHTDLYDNTLGPALILYHESDTITHTEVEQYHKFKVNKQWYKKYLHDGKYKRGSGLDSFLSSNVKNKKLKPSTFFKEFCHELMSDNVDEKLILFMFVKWLVNNRDSYRAPRDSNHVINTMGKGLFVRELADAWLSVRGTNNVLRATGIRSFGTLKDSAERMLQSSKMADLLSFSPFYNKVSVPLAQHDALDDLMEF